MTKYTKVGIKKTVYEQAKIQAAAQNRSVMNYIEQLVLNDTKLAPVAKRRVVNG